MTGKFLNHMLL